MSRPFQIALAIGFIGLIIAIGNGIERHGFHVGTIGFAAVVLGIYSGIIKRATRGEGALKASTAETDRRLSELESRLTDLQDIVISIDDRLSRSGTATTTQSPAASSDRV